MSLLVEDQATDGIGNVKMAMFKDICGNNIQIYKMVLNTN